jgi:hypothetical protein
LTADVFNSFVEIDDLSEGDIAFEVKKIFSYKNAKFLYFLQGLLLAVVDSFFDEACPEKKQ